MKSNIDVCVIEIIVSISKDCLKIKSVNVSKILRKLPEGHDDCNDY